MSLQDDRRDTGGQRVPFEALVVVANPKGTAGAYECEAMDVSEHGMHLRTAYLPELGQALTFRFEGGAGEVVAEGNVLWRDEQAKGGEFGVRFTKMSAESLAALKDVCGISDDAAGGGAPAPIALTAARGARVRLHIEGLASPMRARVRDSLTDEVMVGSNLEFLKVGKQLDLEDVEGGKKRAAFIDRVDVEVDKETKIPQLVVTLRYEERAAGAGPATQSSRELAAKTEAKAETAREPVDAAHEDDDAPKKGALDGMANAARGLADQVGPRLSSFGTTAKGAFSALVAKARTKREDEPARRMTSPPPDGALHASGRKVVRGESEEAMEEHAIEEQDAADSKSRRRGKMIGIAGAGLMLTLLAFFALRAKAGAPPGAEATASTAAANEVAVPVAALPRATTPIASGDAVSANVPLFGTTPLSTTEPAPMPSAQNPLAAAGSALPPPSPADGDDEPAEKGSTTYGKGKVVKPRIVRLKMDAPITEIRGTTSGMSVVLSLPGRRNVESATNLMKKDKRIASVKAVPKDGGVDVTFTFKEAVPPFLAKASGKLLEMDLGETAKELASDDEGGKKHKKKHAVAQKDAPEKSHKKKKKHSDD